MTRLENYKHSHLRKDVATKVKGCSELKQLRARFSKLFQQVRDIAKGCTPKIITFLSSMYRMRIDLPKRCSGVTNP
jgi:hypothetical protein